VKLIYRKKFTETNEDNVVHTTVKEKYTVLKKLFTSVLGTMFHSESFPQT